MMMAAFRKENDEFVYDSSNPNCEATPEMIENFNRDSFIAVRKLFSEEEIKKMVTMIENCQTLHSSEFQMADKTGKSYDCVEWKDPAGVDILSQACRTQKCAGVAQQLLGKGEMYLYSNKLVTKKPMSGGAVLWHQDYGYWYNNRCIRPDFVVCLLALSKSDRTNGGLQVLKGSHLCGRLNHSSISGHTAADEERVELLKKSLPLVECNLEAGDAIFFHANTLHYSGPNNSMEHRRWNLIMSYNTRGNSPDTEHYNAIYAPLNILTADAVARCQDLHTAPKVMIDPKQNPNIEIVAQIA